MIIAGAFRRSIALLIVSVCAAIVPSTALAQTSMSLVSEPGDFIGQGQTLTFDTVLADRPYDNGVIYISAFAPGHSFYPTFSLPPGVITPGTHAFGPGISDYRFSISGDSRGCSDGSGQFTITEAVFNADRRATRFFANFEYHCGGLSQPGIFGEIAIAGPPPPPVSSSLVIDEDVALNRLSGEITVRGTLTCSAETQAYFYVTPKQTTGQHDAIFATGVAQMVCGPSPRAWAITMQAEVTPSAPMLGFRAGFASLDSFVAVTDPKYNQDRYFFDQKVIRISIDNH